MHACKAVVELIMSEWNWMEKDVVDERMYVYMYVSSSRFQTHAKIVCVVRSHRAESVTFHYELHAKSS